MVRKLSFILISLLLSVAGFAQTSSQAQIIQKISAATQGMKSMQCDFVQTKTVKMLNDKMVSRGKMAYQQANKLRWEYTSPYTYTFILNDTKVSLQKNKRNDVIDVSKNKMFKEIAAIMMNSVVGKCLTDTKSFKTTITENAAEYVATLVPQKKEMKQMFKKIVLHFNKKQGVVVRVDMYEKNNDTTVITLENIKKNTKIDAKTFAVN